MAKPKFSEFQAAFVLVYGENTATGSYCVLDHPTWDCVVIEVPSGDGSLPELFTAFAMTPPEKHSCVICSRGIEWDQYTVPRDLFDEEP